MTFKSAIATAAGILALTAPLASAATNRLSTSTTTTNPNLDPSGIEVLRLADLEKPGAYVVEFGGHNATKFAATCSTKGAPVQTKLTNQIENMITMTTIDGPKTGTIDCLLQTWVNDADAHQRKFSFDAKPDLGHIEVHYDRDAKTKENPRNFIVESEGMKEISASCSKNKGATNVPVKFTPIKEDKTTMTLVGAHDPDVVDCFILAQSKDTARSRHFRSSGK
jgi:hypothetical protein